MENINELNIFEIKYFHLFLCLKKRIQLLKIRAYLKLECSICEENYFLYDDAIKCYSCQEIHKNCA